MKTIIKDAESMIGIFSFIDDKIYSLQQTIEESKGVNGMYDAGNLFHIDLLKKIPDMDPNLPEDLKKELKASKNPYKYYRGRVCYNMYNDKFQVFTNKYVAQTEKYRTLIKREFHLPVNKTIFYVDPFYEY